MNVNEAAAAVLPCLCSSCSIVIEMDVSLCELLPCGCKVCVHCALVHFALITGCRQKQSSGGTVANKNNVGCLSCSKMVKSYNIYRPEIPAKDPSLIICSRSNAQQRRRRCCGRVSAAHSDHDDRQGFPMRPTLKKVSPDVTFLPPLQQLDSSSCPECLDHGNQPRSDLLLSRNSLQTSFPESADFAGQESTPPLKLAQSKLLQTSQHKSAFVVDNQPTPTPPPAPLEIDEADESKSNNLYPNLSPRQQQRPVVCLGELYTADVPIISSDGLLITIGFQTTSQSIVFRGYRSAADGSMGYAEEHRLFGLGDVVLKINSTVIERKTWKEALPIFDSAMARSQSGVRFIMRRRSGKGLCAPNAAINDKEDCLRLLAHTKLGNGKGGKMNEKTQAKDKRSADFPALLMRHDSLGSSGGGKPVEDTQTKDKHSIDSGKCSELLARHEATMEVEKERVKPPLVVQEMPVGGVGSSGGKQNNPWILCVAVGNEAGDNHCKGDHQDVVPDPAPSSRYECWYPVTTASERRRLERGAAAKGHCGNKRKMGPPVQMLTRKKMDELAIFVEDDEMDKVIPEPKKKRVLRRKFVRKKARKSTRLF